MYLRNLVLILSAVCFLSGPVYTQYQFLREFPALRISPPGASGCSGLAVDPEGKVWIQCYGATETVFDSTAQVARPTRALYVYYPDGTAAPFSPIKVVTVNGIPDTLYNPGRGLSKDANGDILASFHDVLYRLDYRNGTGKAKVRPQPYQILTAAAADTVGHIYVASAIPRIGPIEILDTLGLTDIGNVADTTIGYSRGIAVSADGTRLYCPAYDAQCMFVYVREGDSYALRDTVLKGMYIESIATHPRTKHLWVSAGSGQDPPNRYPGLESHYSACTWYEYDPLDGQVLDEIHWEGLKDPVIERPRAIAFSITGDTAYVGNATAPWYPTVQMFVAVTTTPAPVAGEYVPDSATVLLLHFNETDGDTLRDASGRGHHGVQSRTFIAGGRFGFSRKFSALNSGRIAVGDAPDLNLSPSLTLEAWIKPEILSQRNTIIAKPGPAGTGGYFLAIEGKGKRIGFGINSDSASYLSASIDSTRLRDGSWHHVAGTLDGLTARIMLDGAEVGNAVFPRPAGTVSSDSLLIGNSSDGESPFYGRMDEVRISSSVRVVEDFTMPAPPRNFKALRVGNQLYSSWNPSAGKVPVAKYRLYTAESLAGSATLIDSTRYHYYFGSTTSTGRYIFVRPVDSAGVTGPPTSLVDSPKEYSQIQYPLHTLAGRATVFSARGPDWARPLSGFNLQGGNWRENDGPGTFSRVAASSGGSARDGILAFPSDSGGQAASTVAEFGIERPGRLGILFGLSDERKPKSGKVRFVLQARDSAGISTLLDSTVTNVPGWSVFFADLTRWSGTRLTLRLITDPLGSLDDDYAVWAEPRVMSLGRLPTRPETEPNNTMETANVLTIGDSIDASIYPIGDVDLYRFSGTAGDTISLASYFPFSSNLQSTATILDASGNGLAAVTIAPSGIAAIPFVVPEPGMYFIQYRAASTYATTGTYRIALRRFSPSAPVIGNVKFASAFFDTAVVDAEVHTNGLATSLTITLSSGGTERLSFTSLLPGSLAKTAARSTFPLGLPGGVYTIQYTAMNTRGNAAPVAVNQEIPGPPDGWVRARTGNYRDILSVAFTDSLFGLAAGDSVVFRTTDGGRSWSLLQDVPPGRYTSVVPASRSTVLAFLTDKRVFRSSNGGGSWEPRAVALRWPLNAAVFVDSTFGIALGDSAAVHVTADAGLTWSRSVIAGVPTVYELRPANRLTMYAVGSDYTGRHCFTRSTDGGVTWWSPLRIPGSGYAVLVADADRLTAWGSGLASSSTDGGITWKWESVASQATFNSACLDNKGSGLAVGTNGTILRTEDGGRTTIPMKSGTMNSLTSVARLGPRTAVVVGKGGTILRYEGSLTDEQMSAGELPASFALEQNYPNPFNGISNFEIRISKLGWVRVAVYDLLGREVTVLVNENKVPGEYRVRFDASGLASGVYLYRLTAGTFVQTRKMMVIR